MTNGPPPTDPRWPRLVALAVHEFRTPLSVLMGYQRMLLKNSAGPLSDQQQRMLEEAQKATVRINSLVDEMSDLATLEEGKATFNRSSVNLGPLLAKTIDLLPPPQDRDIAITLRNDVDAATVNGDPVRLRTAFSSLLFGLRRELVTSSRLFVRVGRATDGGRRLLRIAIADENRIDALNRSQLTDLGPFDEWQGGCGLSLAIARRIVNAHDGQMWSSREAPKAAAVVVLPEA